MGEVQVQHAPSGGAMTVNEFCKLMHISRAMLTKLRQRGEGPEIMFVGRKVLITHRAAEQWARELETKSKAASTAEAA
ncbi:helix-turn-helix domain-containing protein [Paraburkholderia pallida]|uniref:DNA-binding protein n=1 Tax=Paraburkholderia pallida TaxID=2547399 RepID=A0A4P7CUQ3_9BURK|nr:helix-turn-helix domain-containing protein [Paraburkholderia pallida]QBQ97859.1 DNA-binding protein [Paraburkholderia pallida]